MDRITTLSPHPDRFQALTMTSREIEQLTGKDLSHIHRDARAMLDELAGIDDPDLDHVREDKDARGYTTCFHLPKSLTITLMAGYSVKMRHAIVKRWQELEAKQAAPVLPTTASMFFQSAQVMLEMENRTVALEKRQISIEARLDEVVENNVLKVCPQNAESITHIRKRINKMFGLSDFIINEAMRQLPYSPKPAGMVLNDNEAAQGSHYAVFWVKDVTAVFKRFVAECQRETTAFVSHPFIGSRFRLAAGKEAS